MNLDEERFDFHLLEEMIKSSNTIHTSRLLGLSDDAVKKFRERGCNFIEADYLAVKAGLHPGNIWQEWWEVEWIPDELYSGTTNRQVNYKVCSSCEVKKSSREFGSRKTSKDGLTGMCKSCINLRDQERRLAKMRETQISA